MGILRLVVSYCWKLLAVAVTLLKLHKVYSAALKSLFVNALITVCMADADTAAKQ